MRTLLVLFIIVMVFASSASSQQGAQNLPKTTSDPTKAFYLSAADVAAFAAKLPTVPNANTTVFERADPSSISGLGYRMAVDRRTPPQNAAVHQTEPELWVVIDGSGAITTGGKVIPIEKDGKVVGRRIEGGTVQKLSRGDAVMIPEGVPHQVTEFNPSLTFLTFEIPRPRATLP